MTSTSTIYLSSDSDPDYVQIIIPLDVKLRSDAVYKTPNAVFSMSSKYDSPSLTNMRQWFEIFIPKPPENFFISREMENFTHLMNVSRILHLSKTSGPRS